MPNYDIFLDGYGKPINQKDISRDDSLSDLDEEDDDTDD
jgi:hypothetical protein